MSTLDKTEVLASFEAAYEAANGKKPDITAKAGWYSVDGGKNMRLADLNDLIATLGSDAAPNASKAKTTKKAVTKKAADIASVVGPTNGFTITRSNDEGYTAEELWIVTLAEKEHDCRLPRGVV